jgi:chaperonin GroEL
MPSLNPKQIVTKDECHAAIMKGVDAVADVVSITLGPGGRNVLLDEGPFREGRSTRDGVTVAKKIALSDPIANLAAQLVISVARRAGDSAGDGTTTATVLAQAIYKGGVRQVAAGANPVALKRGIDAAITAIVGTKDEKGNYQGGTLAPLILPVEDPNVIAQVGTLSANSDPDIGNMIAAAIAQVGKDGTVTVEESQSMETTLDVVEGMQFNQGYLSPYFITDGERMEAMLSGDDSAPVFLLLHEKRLVYHTDLTPVATIVHQAGGSLVVIAEDIAESALAWLVVNRMQGRFRSIAVKTPGFGDRKKALLDDLAVLTGATVISPDLGIKMESVTLGMLGRAKRVTVTKDDTTIVGGMGDETILNGRRNDLRAQIERTTSDYDRERLTERLAKLTGGVAVVKVGGQTEAEMKERKDRAEDAMYATRAAVAEGIVPGGGTALILAVDSHAFMQAAMNVANEDELAGFRIVAKACEAPLKRIVSNAGGEGGEIVAELRRRKAHVRSVKTDIPLELRQNNFFGYNAATREFEDLLKSGVIDPARVTRTALQAAGSIAGLLLTNEAIVADDVEAASEVRKSLVPVMPGGQQQMLGY